MNCSRCRKELTRQDRGRPLCLVCATTCTRCGKEAWVKKAERGWQQPACPTCQASELNASSTALYEGDVLCDCSICGAVVEAREGWVASAHPTPQDTRVCAGSLRKPRTYEKHRYRVESKKFHESK